MAFTFEERPLSRQKTSNPPSLTMLYVADGIADQATVTAFAHSATPSVQAVIEGILYRQDIRIDPQGYAVYHVSVPYGPKSKQMPLGDYSFSFDTTGGTVHIKNSKQV